MTPPSRGKLASVDHLGNVALLFGSGSLLLVLASTVLVLVELSRRRLRPQHCPPITVLRPVKGIDPGFEENLIAILSQDYPRFQVIVGAADPSDPAIAAARRILARFPGVDARIVAGAPSFGFNPKVRNLRSMIEEARYDWILISDSNVRPGPDYLASLAAELDDPSVRLVHNPIAGSGARSIGDACDHLHLGTFITGAVALARAAAGHQCVIGKSMLLSRTDLERLGGLARVKDALAEDYLIGRMYTDAGLRVVRSPYVVHTPGAGIGLCAFMGRHLRWNQMRRRISPLSYTGEVLLNPIPFLLLAALSHPQIALAGVALKCAADSILLGPRGPLGRALLIPLKDVLILFVWLAGAFHTTVGWRGHRFRIGAGSALVPCPAGRPSRLFEIDAALLWSFRRFEKPELTAAARALTRSGDAVSWAIAGLVMIGVGAGRQALLLGTSALFATLVVQVMKRSIRRTRPDRILVGFVALADNPDSFSFPSGHTATAFAVATAFLGEPTMLVPMLWLHAPSVAASRCYLGAHYPLDVLAGAIVGVMAGAGARIMLG